MEKSELPGELPLVLVPSVREALPSAPGEVFWTVEEARLKTRATEGVVIQNVPGVARPGCGAVGRFRPAVPPWDATRGTAHTEGGHPTHLGKSTLTRRCYRPRRYPFTACSTSYIGRSCLPP